MLKSFKFKKIDAFTKGASPGNPAGCIYLNELGDISQNEMQFVARELKGYVNEVAYLFAGAHDIFFRYYSADCEVDFCGHGTIAAMYDFIGTHSDMLHKEVINIRVKDELLQVYNRLKKEDCVYVTAPKPEYQAISLSKREIARALKIPEEAVVPDTEPAVINAGLNTLIVPISGLQQCLQMKPDQVQLKSFCLSKGIDIILVYTAEVADKNSSFRTRVFAPKFGYLEDPATGSGNSALGYYLLGLRAWDGSALNIEQNSSFDCPNAVRLATVKKDGKMRVIFGGAATVKIDGLYRIP